MYKPKSHHKRNVYKLYSAKIVMENTTEEQTEQTNGLFVTDMKTLIENSWLILTGKNARIEMKGGDK